MDRTQAPIHYPTAPAQSNASYWILAAFLSLLAVTVVNYVVSQRQFARNAQCRGRLAQIGLALQNYKHAEGQLPQLTINDDRGNPLFSWRVSLLPYVDAPDLYAELDLSQPWNQPKNVAAAKRASQLFAVDRFRSPNDFGSKADDTSFVAIDVPASPKRERRIVIVEIHNSGIQWTEPRDLTRDEIRSRIGEMLKRGEAVHVLTGDGQVGTIDASSLTFNGSIDDLLGRWLSPPQE